MDGKTLHIVVNLQNSIGLSLCYPLLVWNQQVSLMPDGLQKSQGKTIFSRLWRGHFQGQTWPYHISVMSQISKLNFSEQFNSHRCFRKTLCLTYALLFVATKGCFILSIDSYGIICSDFMYNSGKERKVPKWWRLFKRLH